MEYYSATKRNEIMPFAAAWMDLEIVILSEVNQTEKEIPYNTTYVWNLKKNYKDEHTYKTISYDICLSLSDLLHSV